MLKHNLGYPRIGANRELKTAIEEYWGGKISSQELFNIGKNLRQEHWKLQDKFDLIPCNDFSFYDHVLDMSFLLGVIPSRYDHLSSFLNPIDFYFSLARGYQKNGLDHTAMAMTKWFDTNYHYIVPEFTAHQRFRLDTKKLFSEFQEAKNFLKKTPTPVLIGPISYLLLGQEQETGFHRLDLLEHLLPVYVDLLQGLKKEGAEWIQLDEPFLVLDLNEKEQSSFKKTYHFFSETCSNLKILLTTYFENIGKNLSLTLKLPVSALHIDVGYYHNDFDALLQQFPKNRILSLGLINGRNIWKNNYDISLKYINNATKYLGEENLMISPSCSLLHVPFDLNFEKKIHPKIKNRMAFARQKLQEIQELELIFKGNQNLLHQNQCIHNKNENLDLIHNQYVQDRLNSIKNEDFSRKHPFEYRSQLQNKRFNLPLFPTTTIGSFPQTLELRTLRKKLKQGLLTQEEYKTRIEDAIVNIVHTQEEIGLDVLVHGEFERNDMVEYFGEKLEGFLVTENGWVQSYGSRCVKPPIIYGDINRPDPMTVYWTCFAQKHTSKPIKGMLTGPITMLKWSFARDDQAPEITAQQIAWAIRDEVADLEKAGINIIQIDEPALREGLPLKKRNWNFYLEWAIHAFKLASSGVKDETQIHTHMCYSEFNEILEYIARMDADVITIETARSQMKLLKAFSTFQYPNKIGPGVYDIHSPRIPSVTEIHNLIQEAISFFPNQNFWINPDCGLKTRTWPETLQALKNMVAAAKIMR